MMKHNRLLTLLTLVFLCGGQLYADSGLSGLAGTIAVEGTDTPPTTGIEDLKAPVVASGGLADLAEDVKEDEPPVADEDPTAPAADALDEDEGDAPGTDEEKLVILEDEEEIPEGPIDLPALPGEEAADEIAAVELSAEEVAAIESATAKDSGAPTDTAVTLDPKEAVLVTDSDWDIEGSLKKVKAKIDTTASEDVAPAGSSTTPTPSAATAAAGEDSPIEDGALEEAGPAGTEVPAAATPPPLSEADDAFLAEQAEKRAAAQPAGPAFTAEDASISTETEDLGDDLDALLDAAEAEAATMPTPEESDAEKTGEGEQRKKNKAEQTSAMKLMAEAAEKEKEAYIMQLKGLRAAGVDVDANGIAFTGKLQLWDGVYARMTAALNTKGFLAQGYVPELALGPLKLTGAGPDGKYGTDDDGLTIEARISKKLTRIMASGMVDLGLAKAQGDVMFGTSGVTIFTAIKILGLEVKFLAESRGKGSNFDFVVQGAADADLIKLLEEELSKAIDFLANTTQKGVEKAQKLVKLIRSKLKSIKNESTKLSKKFKRAKKRLDKKTKIASKVLGPPRRLVQKTTNKMEKVKRATWKVRRAILKGRRKMLRGLRKAFDKLLRTKKSKENAKKQYRKAKRKTKWYKPWTYVAVAFWLASLTIVTAVHAVAESIYIAIKTAISVVPIDVIPPLPAMWVAYAAAKVACFAAIQALTVARLAANPLAAKEMFEMTGLAIAIASIEFAHTQMYVRLSIAIKALDVAHAAVSIGGEFAKAATEVGALALQFVPIMIYGAGFKFSLRELGAGKLPMIGLVARVFGKRKILTAQIDFTKPQTILTALPKMLIQIVAPGSDDFIKKMESINMKHAGTLEKLEKKKKVLKQSKAKWEEKKQLSLESRERIIEKGKTEASRVEASSMKQGEGEFGKKLDLSAIEAKGAGGGEGSTDEFDPKNPGSYACENRNYAFRWNEHWLLPTKNSGAVTFMCSGDKEIVIGLNSSSKAKSLSRIYDIVIGYEGNKGTVIRKLNEKGLPLKLIESRDPIARNKSKGPDDYDAYPYWISYHEGYIACGHGTTPGENIIVEWLDDNPPEKVKAFAFSCVNTRLSFSEITAKASFHRPFGTQYSIYEEMNNFVWRDEWKLPESGNGTITFKAKAGRDIKIGLSDDTTTKHADYIADIGMDGNTRSSLVEVTPDGKEYHRKALSEDPEILVRGKNATYESYWVTHNKGHFAYGYGSNPSENIALEWLDRTPLAGLTHFSFSSWDNPVEIRDIKVQPAVEIPVGSRYSAVNRKGTFEWRPEWKMFEKDKAVIRFRTKGKESLILGLHSAMGKPNESTFKLTIGGKKNTRTFITNAKGKELASTIDPDAMIQDAGTYNDFWVLYEPGFMALGFGDVPGKKLVFEAELPRALPITHFSFSNATGYIEYQKISSEKAVPVTRSKRYTANKTNGAFKWHDSWQLPPEGGVVVFEAMATEELHVGLHTGIGEATDYTFDVILGAVGNRGSRIKASGARRLARENGRNASLQNTSNYVPYWVHYDPKEGLISAGRGATPGEQRMIFYKLSADEVPSSACTHFSFASGAKSEVALRRIGGFASDDPKLVKTLKKMQATTATSSLIQTELVYKWNAAMKLHQKDRGVIYFKARSGVDRAKVAGQKDNPRDIHIAFNNNPDAEGTHKDYGVILNEEGSAIHRRNRPVMRSIADAHTISDPDNYYQYWVSYDQGHIAVGRGETAGKQIMLEWTDKHVLKNIRHFALAGAERFKDIRSEKLSSFARNSTYSAYNRKKDFEWFRAWQLKDQNRGLISFTATAERSIVVGIGRKKESRYTLTIGDHNNSKITLFHGSRRLKSEPYKIPNGTTAYRYWLNFDKGALKLGIGDTPGKNIIFEHVNPRHTGTLDHFSFSSDENQVSIKGIVSAPVQEALGTQSRYTAASRKGQYEWKSTWKAPQKNSFSVSFRAKGAADILVGMHTHSLRSGGKQNEKTYELAIGAENNKATLLRDARNTVRTRNTSGGARIMMPDEFNEYWITYHKGRIMYGSGNEVGQSIQINWVDPRPARKVRYVSFSSNRGTVEYRDIKITRAIIPEDMGTEYLSNGEKGLFNWTKAQSFTNRRHWALTFGVRGKKDALIGFNQKKSGKPTYAINIGDAEITLLEENTVVARTSDKAALLEDEYSSKTYWVNYSNGVLSLGSGSTIGSKELLSHTFSDEGEAVGFYGLSSKEDAITYSDVEISTPVTSQPYSSVYADDRKGSFDWLPAWVLPKRGDGAITFNVKGDADALIGLHYQKRGNPLYSLALGAEGNTQGVLYRHEGARRSKKIVVASSDKAVLSSTSTPYWINCTDGTLSAGTGELGSNKLLQVSDAKADKVTNISFSSGNGNVVFSDIAFRDALSKEETRKAAEQKAAIKKGPARPKMTEAEAAMARVQAMTAVAA